MGDLLVDLNHEQKKAVIHGQGPLLIIAGAGTGKTKVITHRIAYLISKKLAKPEEILAVTFTEKAANEMEERVDLLIPYSFSFAEISTFNSFGERILRNYAHELGYNLDFKLLDEVEQAIFFREHLFKFPLKYYRPLSSPTKHIQELLTAIRRLKQEDIKPEEYLAFAKKCIQESADDADKEVALKHQEMALVYKDYQNALETKGMIDFEDQVSLTVELFRKRPSVLEEIQGKYRFILVDEFQDTNLIQFEMLKLLTTKHKNITVVGDDDQSIFRFRGASLSNIMNFSRLYPKAKKIVLNQNYRSDQDILDAAYTLIQHNNPHRLEYTEEVDKSLKAVHKTEEKNVFKLQFDTLSHETDKVADIILEKVKTGYTFSDFAILVRRNSDADPFLRALSMKEIPFRFSGSRGLYSQKEIRVLVSFIKALTDFGDSRSLFYLALSEIYQLPPYDLTKISNHAQRKNLPLHEVFKSISQNRSPVDLLDSSVEIVREIFQHLIYFIELAADQNAGQVLFAFLEKSHYLKSLAEQKDILVEIKIKNIRLFFDKVRDFSELTDDDSIYAFARHLDALQQVGDNPATAEAELEEDAVHVLTVHKAKGLEFPVVFMVSLIADRYPGIARKERIPVPDELLKEGFFPDKDRYQESQRGIQLKEERRLFYVGMTRAKKILYMTWARDYGLKRLKKVSPFILEALDLSRIPEDTLRSSAYEEILRYSPTVRKTDALPQVKEKKQMSLSFFQVDDYLTCPLKYRYRHIVRVPVLPHYNLIYGRVIHDTIYSYLQSVAAGKSLTEQELIEKYNSRWINEGYLSREHEEMKKSTGERALRRFYLRENSIGYSPQYLEKKFKWQNAEVRFTGRWDRIDFTEEGAVIIDYKATEVKNQEEADKRTKNSLQMDIYALSFLRTQQKNLLETRLHFLESDIIGHAQKQEKELNRAAEKIDAVEGGIRDQDFGAKPNWHNCNLCDFKNICPSSYAY